MENSNLIILILSAGAIIYILFKVAQKVLKAVLVLAIAALAFYLWQGGSINELQGKGMEALFDQSSLSQLEENNCEGEDADKTKCLCIIGPIKEDLSSRLSISDMTSIDLDKELVKKEIRTSLKNKQKEIRKCIVNKKGPEYWDGIKGAWEKLKDAVDKEPT